MSISDLRSPQTLKIVALVALCLLGLLVVRDLLTWWEIPLQVQSRVIPQNFVRLQANQFLYAGLITLCIVIPGSICWRLKRYAATAIISLAGLLAHFIYFNYFRY